MNFWSMRCNSDEYTWLPMIKHKTWSLDMKGNRSRPLLTNMRDQRREAKLKMKIIHCLHCSTCQKACITQENLVAWTVFGQMHRPTAMTMKSVEKNAKIYYINFHFMYTDLNMVFKFFHNGRGNFWPSKTATIHSSRSPCFRRSLQVGIATCMPKIHSVGDKAPARTEDPDNQTNDIAKGGVCTGRDARGNSDLKEPCEARWNMDNASVCSK